MIFSDYERKLCIQHIMRFFCVIGKFKEISYDTKSPAGVDAHLRQRKIPVGGIRS